MKTSDLRNLQALRQLREQRAANALAGQRQRCRETGHALDDAREKLRLHREALAATAEKLLGSFSEGLSISAWQAAQAQLDELTDSRLLLEGSVEQTEQTLNNQERERELFRTARLARQRQAEACDALLLGRVQSERRTGELRDDEETIPTSSPRGGA